MKNPVNHMYKSILKQSILLWVILFLPILVVTIYRTSYASIAVDAMFALSLGVVLLFPTAMYFIAMVGAIKLFNWNFSYKITVLVGLLLLAWVIIYARYFFELPDMSPLYAFLETYDRDQFIGVGL